MAWENRRNGTYYYRKVRDGDRVRSVYLGRGEAAVREAQTVEFFKLGPEVVRYLRGRVKRKRAKLAFRYTKLLAGARDAKARERARRAAMRSALPAAEAQRRAEKAEAGAWYEGVEAVADAALFAAGFYNHNRSWRRRKVTSERSGSPKPGRVEPPADKAEVEALLARGRAGDLTSVPELFAMFNDGERGAWLLRQHGPGAKRTVLGLAHKARPNDLAYAAAAQTAVSKIEAELGGPFPTAVESLLAERAAVCWLRLQHAEAAYAGAGGLTPGWHAHHRKTIESADRMYQRALASLARVRKMAVPVLRVKAYQRPAAASPSEN